MNLTCFQLLLNFKDSKLNIPLFANACALVWFLEFNMKA